MCINWNTYENIDTLDKNENELFAYIFDTLDSDV